MKKVFLVSNMSDDLETQAKPYKERYFIYKSWKKAVKKAKEMGYEDPYGMCGRDEPIAGMMFSWVADKHISILALEIQD